MLGLTSVLHGSPLSGSGLKRSFVSAVSQLSVKDRERLRVMLSLVEYVNRYQPSWCTMNLVRIIGSSASVRVYWVHITKFTHGSPALVVIIGFEYVVPDDLLVPTYAGSN